MIWYWHAHVGRTGPWAEEHVAVSGRCCAELSPSCVGPCHRRASTFGTFPSNCTRSARRRRPEAKPSEYVYVRFSCPMSCTPAGLIHEARWAVRSMATHMALRDQPSETDLERKYWKARRCWSTPSSSGMFPNFAADSYMVFRSRRNNHQARNGPLRGFANRSAAWPESPRFKAKVIASFSTMRLRPEGQNDHGDLSSERRRVELQCKEFFRDPLA